MEEDSAIRPAGQLLKREESIRKFFRLKAGAPDDDRVAQFADYFETMGTTTSQSGLCTMRMGHEQITMW